MERDVSLLRCSKLSCYSEFNRMVQAIARNGGEGDIATIPGTRLQKGTSVEYNFYTTLVLMLKQVISNRDPMTQKRELQRVYEWFCLNKSLIKSKTKPTQRKPKLSITTTTTDQEASTVPFPFSELGRPQTAPASLYQPHRFSSEDTRVGDRRCSSPPKRRPTFTAMYISRSLSRGMDLIGQPFDQLQLRQQKQITVPSKSQERISSTGEAIDGQSKPVDNDSVKESIGTAINVIDFPPSDFPTYQSPSRQRPDTAESTVSLATVFSMAPGVAAQMILEREMNEHYENNRKRALSLHPAQTLRIGGDYQPNRQLVNTPTDCATVEPLHLKRYSARADSIHTSERLKQRREDLSKSSQSSEQPSPSHQGRVFKDQDESKSLQSAIKLGYDETNPTERSSNLEENQIQVMTLPSEAQGMMLDMKVVDGRTSTLSLSQVTLKLQKESPRTKRKQNNSCDNTVSHLQIEGQGFSLDTAKHSPRLASTAAQREHGVNSPRSSTRVTREAKSGSLTSLLIRPVSLQHHSGRTGATSESVNQKVDWNSSEKGDDIDDTGEMKDTTVPGDQKESAIASDANHITENSEEKTLPIAEDSLIRPEEKDLLAKSQNKGDSTRDDEIQVTESQDTLEKTLTLKSADCDLPLVNEKPKDGGAVEELPRDGAPASTVAVAITKELTETCSSLSQDILTMSGEVAETPIMMVKTSPAPVRPHSNRPSSSAHKSRLLSPVNVVTLSLPLGNTHPANRHTTTAEAGRKPPTIIAGFNKKRYRRLKSSPAVIK